MTKATDKVHRIYDALKDEFETGLHNLLWQLLVNEVHKGKTIALAFIICGEFDGQVGIATKDVPGYIPTACAACDEEAVDRLNEMLFNRPRIESMKIIGSSMHASDAPARS